MNPLIGYWSNRRKRLQREWDQWFPLMNHDPLRTATGMQVVAETICNRIGPKLQEAKREIEKLDSAV